MNDQGLRYPLGPFHYGGRQSAEHRGACIEQIASLPQALRDRLQHRSDDELDRAYRPAGWTIRQVVHHIADSHLNAYVRFKLALTEEEPIIKPYDEGRWAQLTDSLSLPPEPSLEIIEGVHARWAALLRSLSPTDFDRAVHHPEHARRITLDEMLGQYAWHGRHHAAHIDLALGE